jgi:DNA-directed RNA polymerase specialized sigma24 family protein
VTSRCWFGRTSRFVGTLCPGARDTGASTITRVTEDDELDRLYACALAWTAAPTPAIEAVRATVRTARQGRVARLRALRRACLRRRPDIALATLPQPLATLARLDPEVRDAAVLTDIAGLPFESAAAVLDVPAPTVAKRAECARVAVAVAHAAKAIPAAC